MAGSTFQKYSFASIDQSIYQLFKKYFGLLKRTKIYICSYSESGVHICERGWKIGKALYRTFENLTPRVFCQHGESMEKDLEQ